jgi:SanA protein
MLKKVIKKMFYILSVVIVSGVIGLVASNIMIQLETQPQIHTLQDAPSSKAAIVFGAGLLRDGTPTLILRDRVAAAVDLYNRKLVSKILVSGDNRFVNYNEPGAMYDYAISMGVPAQDIIRDYAGRRTYDTCYRARAIFGLTEAILVTQAYHLPRALYLCNHLGLSAQGVSSDLSHYTSFSYASWLTREWIARAGALWDIWIDHPIPVLGDPEPIFQTTDLPENVKTGT